MDNYEETETEENFAAELAKETALALAATAAGIVLFFGVSAAIVGVSDFRKKRKQAKIDKEFVALINSNY